MAQYPNEDPNSQNEEGKKKTSDDDKKGKKSDLSHDDALEALASTREEAARNRVENKSLRTELDALKKGLTKALGGGDADEADIKELVQEIRSLKSKLMTSERKEAFRTVAKSLGADSDLTWAYLQAEGKLDDPDVDVQKAIKQALKTKPALKARAAATVGDPGAGGPSEKPKDMNAIIRAAAGK